MAKQPPVPYSEIIRVIKQLACHLKELQDAQCDCTEQNNTVREIDLGTFNSGTISIDTFLDTYSLTVLEDEIVILKANINGLDQFKFFPLGKGIYPTVGTVINWSAMPINYLEVNLSSIFTELQDLQDQIDALAGGSGLQNTLNVQNFAYGQNLRLKNASNSDSEIELNVDDFSEAYLRVTDYNMNKAKNMYVKADHILYSDIEGRECIINFGNISLASLPPVIEPTVVLSVGQNSGFIATQEETQILLDLKADLVAGLVPSSQLPPTVDEILEYANLVSFPVIGESNKYYLDLTTNKTYRWSGSVYVPINEGIALGETSSTAYRGDRGKTAYDHSQIITGNPHGTTKSDIGLSNVNNTADADKPVSTAQATAIGVYAGVTGLTFDGTNISLDKVGGRSYLPHTQTGVITFALSGSPVVLGFATLIITTNGNAITPLPAWKNVGSDTISTVIGAVNRFIFTQVDGEIWYTVKVN